MSKYLLLFAALVITLSCSKDKPTNSVVDKGFTIYNHTSQLPVTVGIGNKIITVPYMSYGELTGLKAEDYMVGFEVEGSIQNRWNYAKLIMNPFSESGNVTISILYPDSILID